jgi:hypothetical protein
MSRDRGGNRWGGRTPTAALRLEKLLAAHGECVMLIVCEWDGQSWSVLDITSHDTRRGRTSTSARNGSWSRSAFRASEKRSPLGESIAADELRGDRRRDALFALHRQGLGNYCLDTRSGSLPPLQDAVRDRSLEIAN